MKLIKLFTLTVLVLAMAWNCDSPTDNESKIAVLSGQVLDGTTLNPIANAGLVVLEFPEISGLTTNEGFFRLEIAFSCLFSNILRLSIPVRDILSRRPSSI